MRAWTLGELLDALPAAALEPGRLLGRLPVLPMLRFVPVTQAKRAARLITTSPIHLE